MNTRVVYVLCGQSNQLCNPAICFATYAYAHPITQSIYVYVCAYVYLARTQHLLPGVTFSVDETIFFHVPPLRVHDNTM